MLQRKSLFGDLEKQHFFLLGALQNSVPRDLDIRQVRQVVRLVLNLNRLFTVHQHDKEMLRDDIEKQNCSLSIINAGVCI